MVESPDHLTSNKSFGLFNNLLFQELQSPTLISKYYLATHLNLRQLVGKLAAHTPWVVQSSSKGMIQLPLEIHASHNMQAFHDV